MQSWVHWSQGVINGIVVLATFIPKVFINEVFGGWIVLIWELEELVDVNIW